MTTHTQSTTQPHTHQYWCFHCGYKEGRDGGQLPIWHKVRWYDFGDEDTPEQWRVDEVCGACFVEEGGEVVETINRNNTTSLDDFAEEKEKEKEDEYEKQEDEAYDLVYEEKIKELQDGYMTEWLENYRKINKI
jgi:hypothetical protein